MLKTNYDFEGGGEFSRALYGNKSIFGVEILHVPQLSDPFLYGLLYYWVGGQRLGNSDYFNLTDIFYSMKWVFGDCGKRKANELCDLTIIDCCQWIKSHILDEYVPVANIQPTLPTDVARFNLMFHPVNGMDWLFLLQCQNNMGSLIHLPSNSNVPAVISEPIEIFEEPLKQAYLYLDHLNGDR